MRPVCKLFKEIATSIGSKKAETLNLSITPLVDGRQQYGDHKIDGYDSETWEGDAWGPEGPEYVARYTEKETVELVYQEPAETTGGRGYHPTNAEAATFDWDSGQLLRDLDEDEDQEQSDRAEYAYTGQMLRLYWHPNLNDPVEAPEHHDYYMQTKPSLGFKIAEFSFLRPNVGIITKSTRGGVTITYDVLEANTTASEEVEEPSDNESADSGDEVVEGRQRSIRYSGKVKLGKVKVDFGVVVRCHARKVKQELQSRYRNFEKERPLTQTEKDYLCFVTV